MNIIPIKPSNPDDIVRGAKITSFISSWLLFFSGLFFVFFPNPDLEILRWILGVNCIIMGGARIFGYYSNDLYRLAFQSGFSAGGFCVAIGVLTFFVPDKAIALLPYVVGIYVLLDGMMMLQTSIDARSFGMKKWLILMITALVVITFGIVITLLATEDENLSLLSGIALATDGLADVWTTMYTVRVRTKKASGTDSERFTDYFNFD